MDIPAYVKEVLEIFGLERSDLEIEGIDLLINCESFEEAYYVRNKLLEAESHSITIHNSEAKENTVVVRVNEVLTSSTAT